MEEALYYCSQCNEKLNEDSQHWFEDEIYCECCIDDETFICTRCNERFLNDRNSGDDDIPLCGDCYDYWYTSCERCGCIITNDDAYYTEEDEDNQTPYCYDCYDQYKRTSYLRSYNYKPDPIFYGDNSRYLGVELEIDNGGKNEDNAKKLCILANKYTNNIYIKSDGSLNNGLEIVTHPMSLEYHIKEMPWESLIECALDMGYISHKAKTCGLHIHINRNSFSYSQSKQDECIGRVLYIVERFWEEMLRFSRRTEAQLERWSRRYGYKERPSDILDTAKKGYYGRYTCINLTSYNTIEFRLFRGTLKYNTLIATLQLVNEICEAAISMSDEEIAKLGWCEFMERISSVEYPELITYLKERRLYINEPVCETMEEE